MKNNVVFVLIFQLCSCSLFFPNELEVVSVTPNEITKTNEPISIEVVFNKSMNRTKAEEAFKFFSKNETISGSFNWENEYTMIFTSYYIINYEVNYTVMIENIAEDINGYSLKDEYKKEYKTYEKDIPKILSFYPSSNSYTENDLQEIVIIFNTQMDFYSVIESFNIEPFIQMSYSKNDSNTTFTFTPMEYYTQNTKYKVNIDDNCKSIREEKLGADTEFYFYISKDKTCPEIINVSSYMHSCSFEEYDSTLLNENIEKDDKIKIFFSEEIDKASIINAINISPSVLMNKEWQENCLILSFENELEWNKIYSLNIQDSICDLSNNALNKNYSYSFIVNGESSKVPTINKIEFIVIDNSFLGNNEQELFNSTKEKINNVSVPFTYEQNTNIIEKTYEAILRFHFETANNYLIDTFSFIDNLSFEAQNNCITLVPNTIKTYISNSHCVVDLGISFTDSKVNSDIIRFTIYKGLKDENNNYLENDFCIEIMDVD